MPELCYCATECWPDGPCETETGEACPACARKEYERAPVITRAIVKARAVRVTQDPLQGGRWQAQYFDDYARVWFDIGDATESHDDAWAKARASLGGG